MAHQSASSLEILFCAIVYFLLLFVAWKNRIKNIKGENVLLMMGILVLCLYSFWGGDYFHYLSVFESFASSNDIYHIEPIYLPFFRLSPNYTFFRFLIWGTSFFLFLLSSKLLHIKESVFLFSFIILYLFRFSYARVSLSIALIMFGYSIIIRKQRLKFIPFLIGALIIYLGVPFHKSAILAVAGFVVGYLCSSKKSLIALLILLPIFIGIFNLYLYEYIDANDLIKDEVMLDAYITYTQSDGTQRMGLGQLVFNILEISSIYYMLVHLFICIHVKKVDASRPTRLLFSASAGLVFLATCFAFTTPIIHKRMLYLSMAPMAFSFALVYEKIRHMKATSVGLFLMVLYQAYLILYNWRVIGVL